jgi:hypothetical protein
MSGVACRPLLLLFPALSLADLVLTRVLLQRADGRAWESNPVASWWLEHFGWAGLSGYKLGNVVLVAALAWVVSRRRPRAAGGLLAFGCSSLLAVVAYSTFLVCGGEAEANSTAAADLKQTRVLQGELDQEVVRMRAYHDLLVRVEGDLRAQRCSLAEAVEALAGADHFQDPRWLPWMQSIYGNRSPEEFLAIKLVDTVLHTQDGDPSRAESFRRDLDAQYRSLFGRPFPCSPDPLPAQSEAGSVAHPTST